MTTRALLILAAALLTSCAGVDTGPRGAAATSPTPAAPVGAATATPGAAGAPPVATPAAPPTPADGAPAAIVGRSVAADRPRLLPAWVPAGMTSRTTVSDGWYTVVYADDPHTKTVMFTDEFGVNPPPAGSSGTSSTRQFRGARATYVVYDGTAPGSQRYLLWDEAGTWPAGQGGMPTNEFFLEASGLTESEFFQVAGSLRPLT